MTQSAFALFIDVMGVQQELVPGEKDRKISRRFKRCRERLEVFHSDLSDIIGQNLPMLLLVQRTVPQPSFVAEFSDSAYIVGERFTSVALAAFMLMRRALRHEYPLRGGIGVGSFSHETSGVRTGREPQQTWSTSSFLGGAVVTAYQAERSVARGLRILIHPLVMRRNTEPRLKVYTVPLSQEEISAGSSHELRLWRATEVPLALERLHAFRDKQELPERARRHYEGTGAAYERFRAVKKDLPFVIPAIWL